MILDLLAHHGKEALLVVASLLAIALCWRQYISLPREDQTFPVAEIDQEDLHGSIMRAIVKYPNTPFVFEAAQRWVILPHKLVNEVKKMPDTKLSFMGHVYERMHGFYTGIGRFDHTEGIETIRNDLTRNIARVLSDLQDECEFAFEEEIGDCSFPKEITLYKTILPIVARVSARIFVGMPLCRDKEWIHATSNLTTNVGTAVNKITSLRPWARPFVVPFLPEIRKLVSLYFFFGRKLKPQVDAIVRAYVESRQGDCIWVKPSQESINCKGITDDNHNLVHWTIKNFKNPETASAGEISRVEIGAAFAAIHTTSTTLSHILFDLASYPEHVEDLRAEIEAALLEENSPDQLLKKTSLPKLKKLDSFMKESQRMSPIGMVNMPRKVVAKNGVLLSTGHVLPCGTTLGFANSYFTTSGFKSDTIMGNEKQPPLTEFAPWRYNDLRTNPSHETRHQFVSVDDDEIAFGGGKHVCPGRFFASNEIKVILVYLLRNYDIGLGPGGQGAGEDGYERPRLQSHDTMCSPDMNAKIWIRKRQL